MKENLEHKGIWWIPNYPEEKVPGIVKYSLNHGITLELIGRFRPTNNINIPIDIDDFPHQEVINGYGYGGKSITLLDCQISNYQTDIKLSLTTFQCGSMIIGAELFTKKTDIKFRQVVVSIQYLNDWLRLNSGFHVEYQFGKSDCKIEYSKPEAISLKLGNHCELSLIPCVRFPAIISDNKATIEQNVNLCISQDYLVQFETLISKAHCFQHLLVLFLQKFPSLLKVTFYRDKKAKAQDQYEYYFWQNFAEGTDKKLQWFDMLLDYKPIEPDFIRIVTKWYCDYKKLLNIYIPYFHGLSNDLNLTDTYLNICRAIEALGRHCGAPVITNSRSSKSRSKVVRAIVYLYNQYKDSMDQVLTINYILRFAWKVTKYRNDLTHANPIISKQDKNFQKTYDMIEQLRAFLTISLLRYHGVSSNTLNHSLNNSYVYSYLRMKKQETKQK